MTAPPPAVTYFYRAQLPYPIEQAYAWLTDYRDDDPDLTTTVVRHRRVLQRTPEEVVLEGTVENLGRTWTGRITVHLFPTEHRWVTTLRDGKLVNHYALTPTPDGCVLAVEYNVYARRWTRRVLLRLARRRVDRETEAMWNGFLGAMARELGPPAPPSAT